MILFVKTSLSPYLHLNLLVTVWSNHLQIFFVLVLAIFGYLQKSWENFQKHLSDLWINFRESSEIFRKSPKTLLHMYCKNIFQYSKRNFLSLHGHIISFTSCLFSTSINTALVSSDPLKTSQGMLSLKVFRLSDKMMTMYKDAEFSAERWETLHQVKILSISILHLHAHIYWIESY